MSDTANLFTTSSAREYAARGELEEWVHLFLNAEGNNAELSKGLKREPRTWTGPFEVELAKLERIVGPEAHMEYVEEEAAWNDRVDRIAARLQTGWDMPPLILEQRTDTFSVRDGNHRLGAAERLGRKICPVIVWENTI
ncbi:hypothetical protein QWJ34_22135 [Saccharibacillus sp. CPCC 101409]|uniref:hypothetical protein n=1 Tax=Saccharibacillus sp. CPCC 101409 TaxID=3058041 RepID=UPI00267220E5|nr:hypothetical protein [Saccharibacillus sp. CPCC 101409]MDO3412480.1 hypothetical protein [Saccharibacillus sp. CPCC 101409]